MSRPSPLYAARRACARLFLGSRRTPAGKQRQIDRLFAAARLDENAELLRDALTILCAAQTAWPEATLPGCLMPTHRSQRPEWAESLGHTLTAAFSCRRFDVRPYLDELSRALDELPDDWADQVVAAIRARGAK